jgi:hypothetical protein
METITMLLRTGLPRLIRRIERDIKALNPYAIVRPGTSFELYGRVACGLAPTPNTPEFLRGAAT